MNKLSTQAEELVRRLQRSTTFVERLFGRTLDEAALTALAELDDPYAAPYLVALALECERGTARRVASVVRTIMASVLPARLPAFDEAYRSQFGPIGVDSGPWFWLKPGDVGRLARIQPAESALLGVASSHRDGHVRQAAVAHLDTNGAGDELPYLLVRLNDWVTPVADSARAAVMRRVAPRFASFWVANLALVHWLSTTSRRSHDDVIAAVFAMLRDLACRPALEHTFTSPDRIVRRLGHRLARDRQRGDFLDLVRLALADDDSVVRLEAIRDAREAADSAALTPVFDLGEHDSFMPVRREAFLAVTERSPATAVTRATRALLDRNAAMRELARFILRQRDATFSFADFYRGVLSSNPTGTRLAIALAGLGETGDSGAGPTIVPFLMYGQPRIRREAVLALARVDRASHGADFLAALCDASPRVTSATRDVLRARPSLIDYDALSSALRATPHVHGKLDALRLAVSLGKWPALRLLLEAAQSSEPQVAGEARDLVRRWLAMANRRAPVPTRAQLTTIVELLDRPPSALPADLATQVRGFLRAWEDAKG